MLTGKHKIGEESYAKFHGGGDITITDGDFGVVIDHSKGVALHALLSEHFGDSWTPCGPDGPFPDVGVEVEVTYLFGETIGGNEIYLPGRAMRSVYGTWVNFQLQEMPEIIAWAYPRKPYEPKGQA